MELRHPLIVFEAAEGRGSAACEPRGLWGARGCGDAVLGERRWDVLWPVCGAGTW